MPEVHNLPPDNGAHEDAEKWENADEKDRRGIREAWETAKRIGKRKLRSPRDFDPAASAKRARGGEKRRKARKVEPPEKGDRRGF